MLQEPPPKIFTVKQFAARNIAFSEGSLRWMVFQSKQPEELSKGRNYHGLKRAVIKNGTRILIDEDRFFEWLYEQGEEI